MCPVPVSHILEKRTLRWKSFSSVWWKGCLEIGKNFINSFHFITVVFVDSILSCHSNFTFLLSLSEVTIFVVLLENIDSVHFHQMVILGKKENSFPYFGYSLCLYNFSALYLMSPFFEVFTSTSDMFQYPSGFYSKVSNMNNTWTATAMPAPFYLHNVLLPEPVLRF